MWRWPADIQYAHLIRTLLTLSTLECPSSPPGIAMQVHQNDYYEGIPFYDVAHRMTYIEGIHTALPVVLVDGGWGADETLFPPKVGFQRPTSTST